MLGSDEVLVGSLAVALSLIAFGIAIGPWQAPYRIRRVASIQSRFGKNAARLIWLFAAILAGTCGFAILNDVRPSYATPAAPSATGDVR